MSYTVPHLLEDFQLTHSELGGLFSAATIMAGSFVGLGWPDLEKNGNVRFDVMAAPFQRPQPSDYGNATWNPLLLSRESDPMIPYDLFPGLP